MDYTILGRKKSEILADNTISGHNRKSTIHGKSGRCTLDVVFKGELVSEISQYSLDSWASYLAPLNPSFIRFFIEDNNTGISYGIDVVADDEPLTTKEALRNILNALKFGSDLDKAIKNAEKFV